MADEGTIHVLDPFADADRWPRVIIESAVFNQEPICERLFALALAYLNTSASLCQVIGENPERQTWPDASVAYFCLHHATELFLKACILSRCSSEKLHHDVSQLKKRYRELFPGAACDFHSPWTISSDDLDRLLGTRVFEGVDRIPDQKYRYGAGRDLKPSQSISSFAPGHILNYVDYLRTRWRLIWDQTKTQTKG